MKTRDGRKKMSQKWLRKLHDEYPYLATQAIALNTRDNFLMHGQKENTGETVEKVKDKISEKNDEKKKADDDSDISKTKKKKIDKHVHEMNLTTQVNNIPRTTKIKTADWTRGDKDESSGTNNVEESEKKSTSKSKSKSKKRKEEGSY